MNSNTKNLREFSAMTLKSGRITSELLAIAADRLDVQAAEIERLKEALNLALEYWSDRQQRYKNRSPVWVQKARAALSGETA